ncbi:glycosyltransferase [Fulvivirga lutea]|uniref:Glycosyltransferase n=1 Tax=Fulvivirga lutea TaxID=2810512 RepID=A0A974WEY0_9BACT|nr:glycosyltransferase [Fulvivirga lutea]QSE97184.1 glycosyltransferase [Fulvivirga lutea]
MHTLVIPSYYPNTYNPIDGIYFEVQAEELAKNKVKVGVIAPIIIKHYILLREKKFDYGLKISTDKIPTLIYQLPSFPVFKAMNDWMRLFYGKKLFKKYIKEYGIPDIVHLHSFENGILARWIKKEYNINYVITEHSTRFSRDECSDRLIKLAKYAFNEAKEVITVSNDLCMTLNARFGIKPTVIPNLIDTDFFQPLEVIKKYDFITVGGLREPKNFELLINSFEQLSNKSSTLAIVGVGPLKEKLINQVRELNLEERISFLGSKSPNELVALFNESKVFVSSSRIETFGVAIIEAMSCGIPVVATKSGGPEYFMTDDRLGMLCDQNQKDLANSMEKVLSDFENYDSEFIRNYIESKFSGPTVTSELKKVYRKYINSSVE